MRTMRPARAARAGATMARFTRRWSVPWDSRPRVGGVRGGGVGVPVGLNRATMLQPDRYTPSPPPSRAGTGIPACNMVLVSAGILCGLCLLGPTALAQDDRTSLLTPAQMPYQWFAST